MRAVALLSEEALVVLDSVRCEGEHLLDVAFHLQGSWEHLPEGVKWQPPAKRGYSYLSEPTIRPVEKAITLSVRRSGGNTLTATLARPDGRKRLLALNPQGTPAQLQTSGGVRWRVDGYFGVR